MMSDSATIGVHLRAWRQRRRLSQLALASEAEISTRHLSFMETGRAAPSREMLLHLAEQLAVPLRDRNILLVSAGYAPVFPERRLDDPALQPARLAIEQILTGHAPYPALAIDRHWTLVSANEAAQRLLAGVDLELLKPPVNVMRISLHPAGLASRIANLAEWRAHLFARLRRQIDLTADPFISTLLQELRGLPLGHAAEPMPARPAPRHGSDDLPAVVPFQLHTDAGLLSFFSTTMMFGTPVDITLSELAIESFFPADGATADLLKQMAMR